MNFAILHRPRTQAILDGKIKFEGFPVNWVSASDPLGWGLSPDESHRDLDSGRFHGGEMSISSFIQAKSQGAPLVALPVFLKRGLVQRSLFCLVGSTLSSPEQLVGKRVGLVSYVSSMAVWMRGVLRDDYGLISSSVHWLALSAPSQETQSLQIPNEYLGEKIQAWEELDGYPHNLDRREGFLLSLLEQGELDAVVSFQARIESERSRPLLHENSLGLYYVDSQIYPINHLFVVRSEILQDYPAIAEALLSVFREARGLWAAYLPKGEQKACESEMNKLGYDPFAYRLGEVEKRTLESFVGYLYSEKLISQKLEVDQLFNSGS